MLEALRCSACFRDEAPQQPTNLSVFGRYKASMIIKSLFYQKQHFSVAKAISLWCIESGKWCLQVSPFERPAVSV